MVVDRDFLECLVHIDCQPHVVQRALLALLHRAPKRNALAECVIPGEVRIPGEQRVDDRLCSVLGVKM